MLIERPGNPEALDDEPTIGLAPAAVSGTAEPWIREGDSVRYDLTVAKSDGSERELEIDGASGKIVEGR